MAIDRDSTIRRAEKLLKQGRLDAAIAAYIQAVEEQPRDWTTANILGDLYAKAGQIEQAVHQYARVANHFAREGFYQKASALYKKIAKIKPQDERVLLQLADLSEQQGLIADAKSCLSSVAERRRRRGDRRGSADILLRLARLDPTDAGALVLAARASQELGDKADAIERFKSAGEELLRRGRTNEGLKALAEAAALDPADDALRLSLLRGYLNAGLIDLARRYVATDDEAADVEAVAEILSVGTPEAADAGGNKARPGGKSKKGRSSKQAAGDGADGPDTLLYQAERELRGGRLDEGRAILVRLLEGDPASRDAVISVSERLAAVYPDAAFVCVDVVSDVFAAAEAITAATASLAAFVRLVPDHVPALMKIVELSVDAGLDTTMYAAQAQLADAYLATGRAAEARVIAEDLVARDPSDGESVTRLRRALAALGEADPDRIIADHLSGASPFALTALWDEAGRDQGAAASQPAAPAVAAFVPAVTPAAAAVAPPPVARAADEFEEFEISLQIEAPPHVEAVAGEAEDIGGLIDQFLGAKTAVVPAVEAVCDYVSESQPEPAPAPDAAVEAAMPVREEPPVAAAEPRVIPAAPEWPVLEEVAPVQPPAEVAAEELSALEEGAPVEPPVEMAAEELSAPEEVPPVELPVEVAAEGSAVPEAFEPAMLAAEEPVLLVVDDLPALEVVPAIEPPGEMSADAIGDLPPPLPSLAVDIDLADTRALDAAASIEVLAEPDEFAVEDLAIVPLGQPEIEAEGPVAETAAVDLSVAIGELRADAETATLRGAGGGDEPTVVEPSDLERVFEMFRDEAAIRGLTDTGAQHLKLAAAFREIGMVEECIGALQVAAHSPRHRFEASALLAQTLRDEGRTREAVEWFERAAEAPAPSAEAGRRLLYDLGGTLSDAGETERALAVFLELQADAPDYLDVAARVRRLSCAT